MFGMTPLLRRQAILEQMNSITRMERGKLCVQANSRGSGAFHKLQCWRQGKNVTRYVPVSQVASVKEALAGHQRFQALAQRFIDLTVEMTRAKQTADAKKNSKRSRPSATGKPKAS